MSPVIPPQERTKSPQPTFNLRRFHAALHIRGGTVQAVARNAQVSDRHVWYVITGHRHASARLLGVIRAAIGESGWAFATLQTDTLQDEVATNGA